MNGSTGTVDRTVAVLRGLVDADGPLTLRELSRRVGLGPSTVHRFLALLGSQGLVAQDPGSRRYGVGPELVRMSARVLRQEMLGDLAGPHLVALVEASSQTALLAVRLSPGEIAYVQRRDPPTTLRYRTSMNRRLSALRTAAGRAILAELPDDQVVEILDSERRRHPDLPPIDEPRLLEDLQQARQRGWAVLRSDRIGAVAVAAPIRAVRNDTVGALTVIAPTVDADATLERRLGERVAHESAALSGLLSGAVTADGSASAPPAAAGASRSGSAADAP